MHETNTFSVQRTDMALWRRRDFHRDNEIPAAFRGTRSALGATFAAGDKYGWTPTHPVSANANPSGIVTDDAFEQIGGMMLKSAREQGPIDGVLLHLHGAMVVDSYEDGEEEVWGGGGRVVGAAAADSRPQCADRRYPRPARQCHAADGRQRQRADRLP